MNIQKTFYLVALIISALLIIAWLYYANRLRKAKKEGVKLQTKLARKKMQESPDKHYINR